MGVADNDPCEGCLEGLHMRGRRGDDRLRGRVRVGRRPQDGHVGDTMPGPVSDSYDPEFGTGANADDVRAAMQGVVDEIEARLGPELKNIVMVAQDRGTILTSEIRFNEREMRLIRFGLLRALESI